MSGPLPDRVRRFPFPFEADSYRYSANVEPAPRLTSTAVGGWGGSVVDVDSDYLDTVRQREAILRQDPSRYGELPHMRAASWDALLWGMHELARGCPDQVTLTYSSGEWHWVNGLREIAQTFVYGDDDTLPTDPLRYIGGQLQEDLVLLDQREGGLWADAGLVTFASNWSMRFNLGMAFVDIHRPVPRLVPDGIIPRAEQFLLRLQAGQDYRRTNWTITTCPRLDLSLETYDEWAPSRRLVLQSGDGGGLFLRVEVQHFVRLAPSGAVLFPIRTYLLPFEELAQVPSWRDRLAAVLEELPPDLAEYKGLTRFREPAVRWLRRASGGQP